MSQQKVEVYLTENCPYCVLAKHLLESKKIAYSEIDVTQDDAKRNEIEKKTGWMTVPIILIGGKLVGGYEELAALDAAGKLEARIRG